MQSKDIEVKIKVPKDWLSISELDICSMFGGRIRDTVKTELIKEATENILKKLELPKIKITAQEIKDRMLTILAEKALADKNDDGGGLFL